MVHYAAMEKMILHLQRAAPPKPPFGAPCNGCGVCCAATTCPAARLRFLRVRGPCPALAWQAAEARYRCGLVAAPARYLGWLPSALAGLASRLFHRWIAAGRGCDCSHEVDVP